MTGRKNHLVRDADTGQVAARNRRDGTDTSQKMMNMAGSTAARPALRHVHTIVH